MDSFLSYSTLSNIFNSVFERLVVIAFLLSLLVIVIRYSLKSIKKEGVSRGLYMGVIAVIEASLLVILIYKPFPQVLVYLSRNTLALVPIRWVTLYIVAFSWSYRVSYEKSGWRGARFVLFILTVILIGWFYDHWFGIVFMSIPVLLIYLYFIDKVAQVILPASNPEDKVEARKKARIFLAYLFGVQHSIWMAEAKTGRNFKERLKGNDSNSIGKPGIVWSWPHQIAGISKGVRSHKVEGPGLIFIDPFEAPVALVDLRMQSRVCTVNTVTKDGIEVPTIVFTAFAIDKRDPPPSYPTKHKLDNLGSLNIDHADGSFPYSSGRVLKSLTTTGVHNPRRDETEAKRELSWSWDAWVVKQVEQVTRLVVAERSLDELWRPKHDDLRASALDEIAIHMQGLLAPQLTEVGINLITVRIVNFNIPQDHPIVQKNINIWRSYWERQIAESNAAIETIYREEIEKAHAYSKSLLLSAIADSVNKARKINEALPRHVIAQYFIHALEEYIKGQPGLNISESKERLKMIKEILMTDRLEGNE